MAWTWQCSPVNAGQTLNKYSIVVLLREATELCLQKSALIPNGFRRAGLYPWNREAPDTTKLIPGTVFQSGPTQVQPIQKEIPSPSPTLTNQQEMLPNQLELPSTTLPSRLEILSSTIPSEQEILSPTLPGQLEMLTPTLPSQQEDHYTDHDNLTTPSLGRASASPSTRMLDNSPPSLSDAELATLLTSLSSQLATQDCDPSRLVSGLLQLTTLQVTVPALLATGVGKVVRRLKDRDGEVGRLAGKLVNRWKRIVLQYEPSTAASQPTSEVVQTGEDVTAPDSGKTEQLGTAVREGQQEMLSRTFQAQLLIQQEMLRSTKSIYQEEPSFTLPSQQVVKNSTEHNQQEGHRNTENGPHPSREELLHNLPLCREQAVDEPLVIQEDLISFSSMQADQCVSQDQSFQIQWEEEELSPGLLPHQTRHGCGNVSLSDHQDLLPAAGELDLSHQHMSDSGIHSVQQQDLLLDSGQQVLTAGSSNLHELAKTPFWYKRTTVCANCSRRVLKEFLQMHQENCKQAGKPESPFETVPEFTLDDRAIQLNKFEVLLLTPPQVQEFNKFFSQKNFDVAEPLFHSWLSLKLAAIPSEFEALQRVLSAHTATNIPKSKQKRKQNLPTGSARYDPTSDQWVAILKEQEVRKEGISAKRKKKDTQKENQNSEPIPKLTSSAKKDNQVVKNKKTTQAIQNNKTPQTSKNTKTPQSSRTPNVAKITPQATQTFKTPQASQTFKTPRAPQSEE